jgi:hypothetical protein
MKHTVTFPNHLPILNFDYTQENSNRQKNYDLLACAWLPIREAKLILQTRMAGGSSIS